MSTDKNLWNSLWFKEIQDQATWELSHPNEGWNSEWPCLSTLLFMQFFVSANPSTTCCDSISRSVSDGTGASQTAAAAAAAAAAASFCCPSYENRLLASSRTELNAALGMYSSPYAAAAAAGQNYTNYFPYSADPSAIYSTLVGSLHPHLMTRGRGGVGGGYVCVCVCVCGRAEAFILIDHGGFSSSIYLTVPTWRSRQAVRSSILSHLFPFTNKYTIGLHTLHGPLLLFFHPSLFCFIH